MTVFRISKPHQNTKNSFDKASNTRVSELQVVFRMKCCCHTELGFAPHFLRNCGRCDGLWTNTCFETVACGEKGRATCKVLLLQQSLFDLALEFM